MTSPRTGSTSPRSGTCAASRSRPTAPRSSTAWPSRRTSSPRAISTPSPPAAARRRGSPRTATRSTRSGVPTGSSSTASRSAREGEAPAFNLWSVAAVDPGPLQRLTDLTIPPLSSGLVPLEQSADGRRLLAAFTGQDVEVGFTVALANGRTRALSEDFETGTVGFDLSKDGSTILAHTGGPDPGNAHNVVSVPYQRGGETKVIVENAAYPDWNR